MLRPLDDFARLFLHMEIMGLGTWGFQRGTSYPPLLHWCQQVC